MEKRKHFGSFFRSLRSNAQNEEPKVQAQESVVEVQEEKSVVEEKEYDRGQISVTKGALLKIWQRWAGQNESPALALFPWKSENIPLDKQAIEQERIRIAVLLEQDAKRRLENIERVEGSSKYVAQIQLPGEPTKKPETEEKTVNFDAECKVYLSKNKLAAWIFIFPPLGEGTLAPESVSAALQKHGVTSGIDPDMMVRVLQGKPYFELLPIALGTPPVEGTNGSVTELFSRENVKEVLLDESGMADYRATNYVRQVYKDTVICDIVKPVPGTPGICVDGSVAEPHPVKAADVPRGVNTTITEDGLHLVATREGHLEFLSGAFQVRPVLEVHGDVDYNTGNIDFSGDVHVHGDVRENFMIRATGTVTVDGLVEAATVEAGGDIVIARGVVGDHRALLRGRGVLRVKYLENCVAYAGKNIYADCIMTSQVFSDDSIIVTSGRGNVIGGALSAAKLIQARTIGAESGRRTELTLGVLPYVESELQNIDEDLEIIRKEWNELKKTLEYLEEENGMNGSSEKLAKARMRKSVLAIKERQLIARQERLELMEPDLSKCRLESSMIYPITSLQIKHAEWVASEPRRRCKVTYDVDTRELKEGIT